MSFRFRRLISTPAGSRNPRAGLWLHCLRVCAEVIRKCGPCLKEFAPSAVKQGSVT